MKKSLKQKGIAVFLVLLIGMVLAVSAVNAQENKKESGIGEEIAVSNLEINMPGVNKYVKLEPDLYDRLQQIGDEEKIKVGIWLTPIDSDAIEKTIIAKYPNLKLMRTKPALDADIDMEVYEKFYGVLTEAKKEAYAAREKPLLDHLKARGFEIVNASDWALDNGADVLSLSFGVDTDLQLTELDRYYDHIIWEHYRAVVKSAGNRGNLEGNVTSPGLGWNVITVGGTDDNDTADWSDDTRWSGSSYKNPVSPQGDRNKPEVSAVAARIQSTENESYYNSNGSWITLPQHKVSGTSFAAPAVAGEIALLINRENWLRNWPEITKAVVMATALHNTYGDRIDDGEGVGTVEASLADRTVNNEWIRGYNITQADLPMNRSRYFTEGTTVRAVICWDSHTDWHVNESKDMLAADLNLEVYHPNGTKITGSYSYGNN